MIGWLLPGLRGLKDLLPKTWPPKDWRAIVALIGGIVGAATLTGIVAWIVWILWRGGWPADTAAIRIDALAKAMLGSLIIIGAVLLSLGFAINRRSIKLSRDGFEASGGGDDAPTQENEK